MTHFCETGELTELDYWYAIHSLGGFIWRTHHERFHGRIEDSEELLSVYQRARAQSEQLVDELWEKFGVVHPKNCPQVKIGQKMPEAPFGMQWYWDWYDNTKELVERAVHESTVCAACPYSRGPSLSFVACSLFQGMLMELCPDQSSCIMIKRPGDSGVLDWGVPEEEFLAQMETEHGSDAVQRWLARREGIRILLREKK